jgi:hypothetical protein
VALDHPAWVEYQRRRFMWPDAERYIQPDAARYGRVRELSASVSSKQAETLPSNDESIFDRELREALNEHHNLQRSLTELRLDILFRRNFFKYRPNQPRVPAGNSDGGQWTTDGSVLSAPPAHNLTADEDGHLLSPRVRLAQIGAAITDAYGAPYYNPGGHHEMPKGVFEKWELQHDTRTVFDKSTTGTVPRALVRASPTGQPMGHLWDGANGAHAQYNKAVKELSDDFLARNNNLAPRDMTPDQGRSLLKEIRDSSDPRIRDYNASIRLLRRVFRLRGGRE